MLRKHKSTGFLKYDPRNINTRHDDWWLIVECSHGLVLTYKWLLEKDGTKVVNSDSLFDSNKRYPVVKRGIRVSESAWRAHISVVRGERPANMSAWNKYHNKRITFEYDPVLQTNGAHWWLPIYSDELSQIRRELGLTRVSSSYEPEYYQNQKGIWKKRKPQFHLTIGKDIEPLSFNYKGGSVD